MPAPVHPELERAAVLALTSLLGTRLSRGDDGAGERAAADRIGRRRRLR